MLKQRHQTCRVSPKLNLTIVIMSLALKLVSYFAEFLMMNQSTFYISFKAFNLCVIYNEAQIAEIKVNQQNSLVCDPVMMRL